MFSILPALVACAAEAPNDHAVTTGDGADPADAIVSEHQLVGTELPDGVVSLTFDDGPGPRSAELAAFLGARGIPATFFINGKNVPVHEDAALAILAHGHLLANHTQNHRKLTKLADAEVEAEVARTDGILATLQPGGPWIFRAPFGAMNGAVSRAINASPMKKYVGSVLWDIGGTLTATSAADWDCWGKRLSVEACGELYMTEYRKKRRGIILLHDIHAKTVEMVEDVLVPRLLAEGARFTPLDEVPSVKRAIAAPLDDAPGCSSASLGRRVREDACVQSRRDGRWYRCAEAAAADTFEWIDAGGRYDPACAETHALP